MTLHVLRHVEAHHRVLVAVDGFGERLGQLRLANAGRPQEKERRGRPAALAKARARQTHGVAHRLNRLFLPDDALVQALLQLDQPLALFGRELGDRNAGELGDDFRDMLALHLRLNRSRGSRRHRSVRLLQLLVPWRRAALAAPMRGRISCASWRSPARA